MSYYLIYRNNIPEVKKKAESYLKDRNIFLQKEFSNRNYNILLFKREEIKIDSSIINSGEKFSYFVTGTIISKGNDSIKTKEVLYNHLLENKFDQNNYYGHYNLIKITPDEIFIYTDKYGFNNNFYLSDYEVVSNSKLLILNSGLNKFTLNRIAVLENIVTGSLFGSDTFFEEIKKFEPNNTNNAESIKFIVPAKKEINKLKSFNDAIEFEINVLENYFNGVKSFSDEFGIDLGITGGFDSRLLMSLGNKFISNIQYHTHYRNNKDNEILIAEELVKLTGKELVMEKTTYPLERNENELENIMYNCMNYNDGLTRMHCYYIEEYNTDFYKLNILRNKNISMTGIGGEIYRNNIFMTEKTWASEYFIKYFLNAYLNGDCIDNKKLESEYYNNLKRKIFIKLDKDLKDKKITFYELKKFIAEIYPSGKTNVRLNSENNLCFTLNPYLENEIIENSYTAIPFLGDSGNFQATMIQRISKELANIKSDYGYNFNEKEPSSIKVKRKIKNFIPNTIKVNKINTGRRSIYANEYFENLTTKFKILNDSFLILKNMFPEIDFKKIINNPDLMLNLFSIGYFIRVCRKKGLIK